MSRFDDMLDWATGYTRKVNAGKELELKEREVRALERALLNSSRLVYEFPDPEAIAYIKRQLDDGCAYVIVPNNIARRLV